jgi:AraC family transcriptional regulator
LNKLFPSKHRPIINITDKINLNYIKLIGENGILFDPDIVIKPGFYIAGIKYKINIEYDRQFYEANQKGNDFYYNRRHEIDNILYPDIYIGLVDYKTDDIAYSFYMPSVQVSMPGRLPEDIICHKVPTNKYAVFKYIGLHHARNTNIKSLYDTFKYIYMEWLPKSGYSQSAPYHFEKLDESVSREDYCEVELYIPI